MIGFSELNSIMTKKLIDISFCLCYDAFQHRKSKRGLIMEIKITANELICRGVWLEACEILGFNDWTVNEGHFDGDKSITFTEEQARTLRLIR